MRSNRLFAIALVAFVPLVSACKKKTEEKKAEPAPPPAAAPVAAPAPAPAPAADMKVSVKTSSAEDSGDYDGANAIYINQSGTKLIALAKDCPTFKCGMVTYYGSQSDDWKKDCAKGRYLAIKIGDDSHKGDPKVGATQAEMEVGMSGASNGVTAGAFVDGVNLTEVAADHISGTVDLKGDNTVHGAFKAKLCPN